MKWQARPRSRARRIATWSVSSVLVLALAAVAGIAWYFSGVAIAVNHTVTRDLTLTPDPGGIRITRTHYSELPGRYALAWEGGWGTVGPVTGGDANTVVRTFTPNEGGVPAAGTSAEIDAFAYRGDPRTALDLDFREVSVPGELGNYPAWFVPAGSGAGSTWVVFVHGHDSNRQESLRYLTLFHRLGLPTLVPTYRNDVGAPPSPDGANHLGASEWRDVESAIRWALTNGAKDVVLAGWSMGAAVSLQAVDRSDLRSAVRGLLLDSPVLDWVDVFITQGGDRGLPGPLTRVAVFTVERRIDADFSRFDWVSRAKDLSRPMLVFANTDDIYVPSGPAKRVAAARPDLVTLVDTPGADHTRAWNVDPERFDATVTTWLQTLGVVARDAAVPAAA